jgi:uncharacterized membrane protein
LIVQISNQKFLIFAVVYAVCTTAVYLFAPGIGATILLCPFFLFFPGHAILSLVFPYRNNSLGKLARIFAGIGVSIAAVTLIALIIALLSWGLAPLPVVIAVMAINVFISLAAIARDWRIPGDQRLEIKLSLEAVTSFRGASTFENTLSIVFIVLVIFAAGALVFSVVSPPAGEQFTEFFIQPSSSGPDRYLGTAVAGQPSPVTAVITNRQNREQSYEIRIVINNKEAGRQSTSGLIPGQRMEIPLQVTFNNSGPGQKAEFYLYKAGQDTPLLKDALSLTVDVSLSSQKP